MPNLLCNTAVKWCYLRLQYTLKVVDMLSILWKKFANIFLANTNVASCYYAGFFISGCIQHMKLMYFPCLNKYLDSGSTNINFSKITLPQLGAIFLNRLRLYMLSFMFWFMFANIRFEKNQNRKIHVMFIDKHNMKWNMK